MADKIPVVSERFDNENVAYGFMAHKRVHSNVGERFKVEFAPEIQPDGSILLHEVGKTDLQAEINSHRDSCDINVILTRYKNGDIKALERRQALYFDASDAPTSYAEMLNRAMKAEQYFNTLDSSERAEFDNDWTKWLVGFDDPERVRKFGSAAEHAAKINSQLDKPGDRLDKSVLESEVSA